MPADVPHDVTLCNAVALAATTGALFPLERESDYRASIDPTVVSCAYLTSRTRRLDE